MKRGDFFLIALLGMILAASTIPFFLSLRPHQGTVYAEFWIDGKRMERVDLNAVRTNKRWRVGEHHEIAVEIGRARILHSDCADQDCVRTGWLTQPGSIAVCLPYRSMLKITDGTGRKGAQMDALSF